VAGIISCYEPAQCVCVFHLVRPVFTQRTTKNTSEKHQVTFFSFLFPKEKHLFMYSVIFCLYTSRRRNNTFL